jgi:hypothetical protein
MTASYPTAASNGTEFAHRAAPSRVHTPQITTYVDPE